MKKKIERRSHLDTKKEQQLKNTNKGRKIERSEGGKKPKTS